MNNSEQSNLSELLKEAVEIQNKINSAKSLDDNLKPIPLSAFDRDYRSFTDSSIPKYRS